MNFGNFSVMEEVNEHEVKVVVTTDVGDEECKDSKIENETKAKTDEIVLKKSNSKEQWKIERSKSLNAASDLEDFDSIRNRVVSIVSLNELGGNVLVQRPCESSKSPKPGAWYTNIIQ